MANYWGHRLTHRVPFLWRFHSVHHSIEQMDWVASGRLHPLDQAFTQAFTIFPLVLLGYGAGVFGGVAVFITLLALFQHANVRLRFPGLRWVINTPEWHHWHHAIDDEARDKNFGLPVVDKVFGTAYLPKGARPVGFGTRSPVPADGYLRHLAYPFTAVAKGAREGGRLRRVAGMRILDLDQRATPESAVEAHVALPESLPTDRAFVRLNMISSVDGGTAVGGVSGGLGNRDDHAVFAALRAGADGCIVGLGTVIAEEYQRSRSGPTSSSTWSPTPTT